MKDAPFATGEARNEPFVELESEKIIKAFARQLQKLGERRDWTGSPGSLVLAFEQQQRSRFYNGAGRLIHLFPQTIILIGRPGRLNEDQLYYVQGVFKELGKVDRLTSLANMDDLTTETAVREVMQQRNAPSLTKIQVRQSELSIPGEVKPVTDKAISPLLMLHTKTLRPHVTLG